MKRIVGLIALLMIGLTGCSYQTLDEAIQSEWDTPVSVLMREDTKNSVIFLDHDQYVFNTFEEEDGEYRYSTDGEDGWTFSGVQISMLVRTFYKEGTGPIVWGALKTNTKLKEIELTFVGREQEDVKHSMTLPLVNNAFIGYPPETLYSSETDAALRLEVQTVVYDEHGTVVMKRQDR